MKKTTLSAIYSALLDSGYESTDPIMEEIAKDLNRGEAEKAQKAEAYEMAKPIILGALSDTPATISEIYDEVASELPADFSKGKVQYAITRLWKDEVTKVDGKVSAYVRKA